MTPLIKFKFLRVRLEFWENFTSRVIRYTCQNGNLMTTLYPLASQIINSKILGPEVLAYDQDFQLVLPPDNTLDVVRVAVNDTYDFV